MSEAELKIGTAVAFSWEQAGHLLSATGVIAQVKSSASVWPYVVIDHEGEWHHLKTSDIKKVIGQNKSVPSLMDSGKIGYFEVDAVERYLGINMNTVKVLGKEYLDLYRDDLQPKYQDVKLMSITFDMLKPEAKEKVKEMGGYASMNFGNSIRAIRTPECEEGYNKKYYSKRSQI